MKNDTNTAADTTAALITSGTVLAKLVELRDGLGIKTDSCSSEEYGALIMMTLAELDILPKAKVGEAMMAWNYIPKNPSAMRQAIWKEEKPQAPAVSNLVAKYMQGGK